MELINEEIENKKGDFRSKSDKYNNIYLEERFWEKVDKKGEDECWIWKGATNMKGDRGYGVINIDGKMALSHRVSWSILNGNIPEDKCVLHRCDNPKCVNPYHLWIGTAKDNGIDCSNKGRKPSFAGELCGNSILTWVEVNGIREEYKNGNTTQLSLARKYGISKSEIYSILKNERWKQ